MATLKIKDADCNEKFMSVSGAGTEADPFRSIPADFIQSVSRGQVPGHSVLPVISVNPSITNVGFTDIWDEGGVLAQPTVAESWEMVSTNAADDASGIGARSIAITSLDANFDSQTSFVATNGGTVAIPGTHIRPRVAFNTSAGSNGVNVGDIVIQVAGGGVVRNRIPADVGTSGNSQFTVPAGFTAAALSIQATTPKGADITARTRVRVFGSGSNRSEFSPGTLPIYQSTFINDIPTPIFFPEKTDFWLQAKSTNISVAMTAAVYFLLIDLSVSP